MSSNPFEQKQDGLFQYVSRFLNPGYYADQAEERQRNYNTEAATVAHGRQISLMEKQNQQNIENWQMQTAYNSPSAEMERLRAAGINPAFAYGSGSGAGSAGAIPGTSAPSVAQAAPYQQGKMQNSIGALIPLISTFQGLSTSAKQLQLMNSQIDKTNAEADAVRENSSLRKFQALMADYDYRMKKLNFSNQSQYQGEAMKLQNQLLQQNINKGLFDMLLDSKKFDAATDQFNRRHGLEIDKFNFDKDKFKHSKTMDYKNFNLNMQKQLFSEVLQTSILQLNQDQFDWKKTFDQDQFDWNKNVDRSSNPFLDMVLDKNADPRKVDKTQKLRGILRILWGK